MTSDLMAALKDVVYSIAVLRRHPGAPPPSPASLNFDSDSTPEDTPRPTVRTTTRPMKLVLPGTPGVNGGRERIIGAEDFSVPSAMHTLLDYTVPRQMVTIKTAENKVFEVHSNLLCFNSPFFAAAFKGAFAESVTASMELLDVDPKVFGLLVHWCYAKEIAIDIFLHDKTNKALMPLAELWTLANRFMMAELETVIIDVLGTLAISFVGIGGPKDELIKFMHFAYDTAVVKTGLKTFVSRMWVLNKTVTGDEMRVWATDFPNGFLQDLLVAMKEELRARGHEGCMCGA